MLLTRMIRADHALSAQTTRDNSSYLKALPEVLEQWECLLFKRQRTKCTTHHHASRQNPRIPNEIHEWTTRPEKTLDDSCGSHDSWIYHTIPTDRTKWQIPPWPKRHSNGAKSLLNNMHGSTARPFDSWMQKATHTLGAYHSWLHYRSLHDPYESCGLTSHF